MRLQEAQTAALSCRPTTSRTYDCPESKDGHTGVRLDFARVQDGSETGGDATAKQADLFQGGLFGNLGAANFGQHRVLGHGAASHKVVNGLPAGVLEANCAVGHDAFSLRAANGGTEVGLGAGAKDALGLGALRGVAGNDVVARLHRRDTVTHCNDCVSGCVSCMVCEIVMEYN